MTQAPCYLCHVRHEKLQLCLALAPHETQFGTITAYYLSLILILTKHRLHVPEMARRKSHTTVLHRNYHRPYVKTYFTCYKWLSILRNSKIMHFEILFTVSNSACHSHRPQTLLKNKEAVCSQLTLILEVVSLKCSVGPSGRCEITIPLGFFLSSFITITSV